MTLEVIGAGVGRTGTYSLKMALEQLGLGPCHHMEEVLSNQSQQVPLWTAAVQGRPNWTAAFEGYVSAVDWPTAAFWRELAAYYPGAKVILTTRSPDSWYRSYSETIHKLLSTIDEVPAHMKPWFEMAIGVTVKSGFGGKTSRGDMIKVFEDHVDAVRTSIPRDRLLVFEVKDGWEPLCAFLGRPVPTSAFPRSNDREEFWELVQRGMG
ncbi:MAG: hypothetical protein F9K44_04340 [Hyphomicrobiaceae bacterium]|nr:MAG: hypothetical protein F9K44_04340 [Hyphomicrobiaceae bacterium]